MRTDSPSGNDHVDPRTLRGFGQAVYISRCFDSGMSLNEITKRFDGGQHLVHMRRNFLVHDSWMAKTAKGWKVTSKVMTRTNECYFV